MTTYTVPLTEAQALEAERAAYTAGRAHEAALLARIAELESDLEQARGALAAAESASLSRWEQSNGPADEYRDFFFRCFLSLPEHYPAPSITSEYDQAVIFYAIERGNALEVELAQTKDLLEDAYAAASLAECDRGSDA